MVQDTSILKDSIVNKLQVDLDTLIMGYEQKIKELTETVDEIKSELLNAKYEEKVKSNQLEQVINGNLSENEMVLYLFTYINEENKLAHRLWREYPDEAVTLELKTLKRLLDGNRFNLVSNYIQNSISLLKSQKKIKNGWTDLLVGFLITLFEKKAKSEELDEELTGCYLSALRLLINLVESPYNPYIKLFLSNNAKIINTKIIDLNDTDIITTLANCYFIYKLENNLLEIIQLVINEWDFIDSNISEEEFFKMLWFAFLVKKDQDLIDQIKVSLKYMDTKRPELETYLFYNDILNGVKPPAIGKLLLDYQKRNITLFTSYEKGILFDYLDNEINEVLDNGHDSMKKNDNASKGKCQSVNELRPTKEELYIEEVSKLPNKVKRHPTSNSPFLTRKASIAIYKSKDTSLISHYAKVKVSYLENETEYFISKTQLKILKKKEMGKWITVVYKDRNNILQKRERIQLKVTKTQISDAETIINNTSKTNIYKHREKEVELDNDVSLGMLGYKVTDLSREERWDILSEKAIPNLGLKRVVEQIATLLRARRNRVDYINSKSIIEWEYDLERLRKQYYKSEFTWPNTTV